MKRKTKKQLAREDAQHRATVKRACKAASLQTEEALLTAAPILRFCGQLFVQSREAAVSTAIDPSLHREEHLVFLVDGAVHKVSKSRQDVLGQKQIKLAAAVAHRVAGVNSEWSVTSFSVPLGGRHHYLQAEMAGIAGALGMALSSVSGCGRRNVSNKPLQKVVVLTDCQAALCELRKLQSYNKSKEQLRHYALGRKLITRSQYLQQLGISLDLHWIPRRHKTIPGSILVDAGARRAARETSSVSEEEAVQISLPPLPHNNPMVKAGLFELKPERLHSLAPDTDEKLAGCRSPTWGIDLTKGRVPGTSTTGTTASTSSISTTTLGT